MADPLQPSDPGYYGNEGEQTTEDYLQNQQWNPTLFAFNQNSFDNNSAQSPSQRQALGAANNDWRSPSQPQATINMPRLFVHSAPQLSSRRAAIPRIRHYHSGPTPAYRQSNGPELPAMFFNDASQLMLPANTSLQVRIIPLCFTGIRILYQNADISGWPVKLPFLFLRSEPASDGPVEQSQSFRRSSISRCLQ